MKIEITIIIFSLFIIPAHFKTIVLSSAFPGAKSHHPILQNLGRTLLNSGRYDFFGLVHASDEHLWKNKGFKYFTYGTETDIGAVFNKAVNDSRRMFLQAGAELNEVLHNEYEALLKNVTLLEEIRALHVDIITSDTENPLIVHIKKTLQIPKSMYISPNCLFHPITDVFNVMPSYMPMMRGPFSNKMSFKERFLNELLYYSTLIHTPFMKFYRSKRYKAYNYSVPTSSYDLNSMFMWHCLEGFHYAVHHPPNFVTLGAPISYTPAPIAPEIQAFIDKFDHIMYFALGNHIQLDKIDLIWDAIGTYNKQKVGFIVGMKEKYAMGLKSYANILRLDWAPQNDILAHPKTKGFITHGGMNSVYESIYHGKPMIAIGLVTLLLDPSFNAAIIEDRGMGFKFTSEDEITGELMQQYIEELLTNETYRRNVEKLQPILKSKNSTQIFLDTVDYVVKYGYEHLVVKADNEMDWITLHNFDVKVIIWGSFTLILACLYKLCQKACLLCSRKKEDQKIKIE